VGLEFVEINVSSVALLIVVVVLCKYLQGVVTLKRGFPAGSRRIVLRQELRAKVISIDESMGE
jgi:hypothetical protein